MTLQQREHLSNRLWKAAEYAEKEWEFRNSVVHLAKDDADAAYQRYLLLMDAATEVYDFDFDKGE